MADQDQTTGTAEAVNDGVLTLKLTGTDYRLALVLEGEPPSAGSRTTGTIHARARRVDVVPAGGRYIEPVAGRPRRVQGRIIGGDPAKNTITVKAATAVVCTLTDSRQKTTQFATGQLVSFDVEPGATFTLA
ncbi:MAG: hypothetical protein RIG82_06630 [Phycisphaeraceae bacterium]